ncbi:hypothetical protein AC579_83 [Pseudocercospora musae]|uniref:Ams2/SPT21 N-terminal domain-containing protein n=1 Tax=Pseudocercospora musae TaxID=113226 RepID=A0A139IH58_9PEZI|nr:hypothetical protein AC579_83 [Pseudocercospora musae]
MDDEDFASIPTRPMRVKVLYTFDKESKTTCLARFPNTLHIPAVAIDGQSQVGVIELQQCIQTIVTASPEILSQLDNADFSVYSFDYSEFDAPVVGQGRLSSLLSSSNPQVQGDKTMITGRVCKNIALFNNGVKETLEVKFKFTPICRPSHAELTRSGSMRSLSPATSSGFDPNAWNHQNRVQQQTNDYFNMDFLSSSGNNGAQSLEVMFGMATESGGHVSGLQRSGGVGVPETPNSATFSYNPAFASQSHSAPGTRAGSPMMTSKPSQRNYELRHQNFSGNPSELAEQNRPVSRGSVRSESGTSHSQQHPPKQTFEPQAAQPTTEVFYNEDGQPRKRAKVTQADWRGKSSFGSKSSDLRVTAATASSMHMFRPIAKKPSAPGSDLEPPPRVPTPVPSRIRPFQRVPSAPIRSALRQASVAESEFMSDVEPMSDAMTSPEGSSPGNSANGETPMDIPSSPPIVPGYNMPQPSSPGLPALPPSRMLDSGYMSERGSHSGAVMESLEDDENRSPDADDLEMAAHYRSRNHLHGSFVKTEGSPVEEIPSAYRMSSEVPHDLPIDVHPLPDTAGHQRPRAMTASTAMSPGEDQTPMPEAAGSRRGSLALPPQMPQPKASSRPPPKQKRQPLQRSRTATNDSEAGSPAPSDTEGRPRGAGRSGSSAPRRIAIEKKLQQSIANGEMPMFCSHCGAIDTPTWRKLYVKNVDGKPGRLDSVEGEGETIGIEVTERDDEGESTKFVIRKSMKKTKNSLPGVGFEDTVVCNPCGLWFNKFRAMRPSDRWNRKSASRKSKKMRAEDFTDGPEPQSEPFFTDQVIPAEAVAEENEPEDAKGGAADATQPQKAPTARPRANSMQVQQRRAASDDGNVRRPHRDPSFMRAIQSSPVRPQGSQDSPIELDVTPEQPTRRLLFPSPRREGEEKTLNGEDIPRPQSAPSPSKGLGGKISEKVVFVAEQTNLNVFEAFTHDKENMAPPIDENDDLSHLFEGSPSAVFKTPARKTPSKSTPRSRKQQHFDDLLKTPTQDSRKRKPLTPNANAANNADMSMNDFMTSPSSSRYFLRSTPSRLDRTPGGRSVSGGSQGGRNGGSNEVSPFSRHLAQMLNDSADALSDPAAFTSPNRQFDFSDLPTFTTPGRDMDWKGLDEILSSEFAGFSEGNGMDMGNA